jgi:DsbC/DsbD-like thiol-disulfide interchange protein
VAPDRERVALKGAAIRRVLCDTLAVLAVVSACATAVRGQTAQASHGTVALISEDDGFEPGRVASIGVLFDLRPGWHIYWVNPGDAGEPPRIQWELPAGFQAGDIRWPAPLRLPTGGLMDYGYEGRILLPVPLHVPASHQPGTPTVLAADIRYIVCRDVCVSARARVALSVPSIASQQADLASRRELFRFAEARSPKVAPATWKVRADESRDRFVLSVQTGSPETTAVFFPLEPDQIDNAAAQVVVPVGRDGLRITLRKSGLLEKPISVLKGLVVFGPDRAFEIAAPVSAAR